MLLFKWLTERNDKENSKESPLCPKCKEPMESFTPWGCPVERRNNTFCDYFGNVTEVVWRCTKC